MRDEHSDDATSHGGVKKSLASIFKSPAVEKRNKVLASTFDKEEGDTASIYSDLKATPPSDEEKAKMLVDERNASSPTGHFVLGKYRPVGSAQGYKGYYGAQAALGK